MAEDTTNYSPMKKDQDHSGESKYVPNGRDAGEKSSRLPKSRKSFGTIMLGTAVLTLVGFAGLFWFWTHSVPGNGTKCANNESNETLNCTLRLDQLPLLQSTKTNSSLGLQQHASISGIHHLPIDQYANETYGISEKNHHLINELREEIRGKVTQEYMLSTIFLSRWLEEKNWDVEEAKEMLLEHLEWRSEYSMDTALTDNFFPYDQEYPIYTDGYDREGRPLFMADIAEWDVRKVTVSGKGSEFTRYLFSQYEVLYDKIRHAQSQGQNVTQWLMIFNMNGFNFVQHGCFHCIKYYVKLVDAMDENYPRLTFKLVIINLGEEFRYVTELASAALENVMEVFGVNKAEWGPVILKYVSPDQIRSQFGGTRPSGI